MAELTLNRADNLSPTTVRNQIVRDLNQFNARGPSIDDIIPTLVLSDSEEQYYRMDSAVLPMKQAALDAEAPIADTEDMSTDTYNVDTFQQKRSPERGADFELNTDQELLNAFQWVVDQLERAIRITREIAGWQGLDDVDGLIGEDGNSAHSDIDSTHVITPGTAWSDHANSTPQDDLMAAEEEVSIDGLMLDELPVPTAYIPPSVMYDLRQNDDLEGRFSGVETQGLTEDQVAGIIPVENVQTVWTKTIRRDDNGQPIDSSGNVVQDRSNAVKDNILEPWDEGSSTNRRNVVIGTAGDPRAAAMPVLTDRLNNIVERADEDPVGSWSVDNTLGFVTQSWMTPDPVETWYKVAQEIGVEMVRPENWAIIQDI